MHGGCEGSAQTLGDSFAPLSFAFFAEKGHLLCT